MPASCSSLHLALFEHRAHLARTCSGRLNRGGHRRVAVAWWWSLSRRHGDRLPLTANQDRGGLTAELAQYRWCLASGSWLLRLQDNTLGYLSGTNKRKEQGMKGKKKRSSHQLLHSSVANPGKPPRNVCCNAPEHMQSDFHSTTG